jgi:hypothetical protein
VILRAIGWIVGAALAAILIDGVCQADELTGAETAIKEGAQIDKDCLKLNVLKDVGACRVAATGIERPAPVMLGLYFHMWFSDAVLAELYRGKKAEVADKFEQLADAEFPAVTEYESKLSIPLAELCRIVEVNCATAARYHDQWRSRLKQKRAAVGYRESG